MKCLTDYTEEKQKRAFEEAGAFFAFSQAQFDEKKIYGVVYANAGAGLICPADRVASLAADLKRIRAEGIADDIAENGIEAIIERELNNHEAYYTMDIDSTVDALAGYPVTAEDVYRIFRMKI